MYTTIEKNHAKQRNRIRKRKTKISLFPMIFSRLQAEVISSTPRLPGEDSLVPIIVIWYGGIQFQKILCGGKKLKHREVGNECRLIRCPIVLSFVFYLSKRVTFSVFLSVCLLLSSRPLHLLPTLEYIQCIDSTYTSLIYSLGPYA